MPGLSSPGSRAKDPGPEPKASMSSIKRVILHALAGVFDVLKLMCLFLVFFAPALIGAAAAAKYGSAVGWAAGVASGLVELIPGVAFGVAMLGIILAFAVAAVGWMFFITFLLVTSPVAYVEASRKRFLSIFIGMGVSFMPFIGSLIPTFTLYIGRVASAMHTHDKDKHAKWKKAQDAWLAAQSQNQAYRVQQMQINQMEAGMQQATLVARQQAQIDEMERGMQEAALTAEAGQAIPQEEALAA